MKIVKQSSTDLILQLQPWGIWMFGSVFITVGLVVGALLSGVTTFTCDRTNPSQGTCYLETSGFMGSERQEFPLATFQGAEIETSRGTKKKSDSYRVVFVTQQNEAIPFTSYFTSGVGSLSYEGHRATADRFNQFLQNSAESTLTLQHSTRLLAFILGGIFAGVGVLVIVLAAESITCHFDKTLGCLTLQRQRLWNGQITEYSFRQIKGVQVQESHGSKGSRTYRVALQMQDRSFLPLMPYYSSGRWSKEMTANAIAKFLNLEVEQPPELFTFPFSFSDLRKLIFGNPRSQDDKIQQWQAQLQANPADLRVCARLALALQRQGRHEEMEQVVQTAIQSFRDQGDEATAARLEALIQKLTKSSS